jgi:hypothetical protein
MDVCEKNQELLLHDQIYELFARDQQLHERHNKPKTDRVKKDFFLNILHLLLRLIEDPLHQLLVPNVENKVIELLILLICRTKNSRKIFKKE